MTTVGIARADDSGPGLAWMSLITAVGLLVTLYAPFVSVDGFDGALADAESTVALFLPMVALAFVGALVGFGPTRSAGALVAGFAVPLIGSMIVLIRLRTFFGDIGLEPGAGFVAWLLVAVVTGIAFLMVIATPAAHPAGGSVPTVLSVMALLASLLHAFGVLLPAFDPGLNDSSWWDRLSSGDNWVGIGLMLVVVSMPVAATVMALKGSEMGAALAFGTSTFLFADWFSSIAFDGGGAAGLSSDAFAATTIGVIGAVSLCTIAYFGPWFSMTAPVDPMQPQAQAQAQSPRAALLVLTLILIGVLSIVGLVERENRSDSFDFGMPAPAATSGGGGESGR